MKHKVCIWQGRQWVELPGVAGFDWQPEALHEWHFPDGLLLAHQGVSLQGTLTPEGTVLIAEIRVAALLSDWLIPTITAYQARRSLYRTDIVVRMAAALGDPMAALCDTIDTFTTLWNAEFGPGHIVLSDYNLDSPSIIGVLANIDNGTWRTIWGSQWEAELPVLRAFMAWLMTIPEDRREAALPAYMREEESGGH